MFARPTARTTAHKGASPKIAPGIVHDVLGTPGRSLDATVREGFETRFGCDFSRVRVHADSTSAESARGVAAQAFTVGEHIVFAAGRYAPAAPAGWLLLAHELAHVVQQRSSSAVPGAPLRIGDPADAAEQGAEAASRAALAPPAAFATAGRGLQPDPHPVLRRVTVKTWAGDLEAPDAGYKETYEQEKRSKKVRPGVDIHILFKPTERADAEEIGFVQAVTTTLNGNAHAINKQAEARSIPFPDPAAGLHIDAGPSVASPIIEPQYGVHYAKGGKSYERDAEMTDNPGFAMGDQDSAAMHFETAAVAVRGAQAGVYFGAAKWGWTREPGRKPTKIPFTAAASALPGGSDFAEAARLWDASKTSGGKPTEHLPVARVKFIPAKTTLVKDPAKPKARGNVYLAVNTQVQVTEQTDPTHKDWLNVVVVSGAHVGQRGWLAGPLSDSQIPTITPKKRR